MESPTIDIDSIIPLFSTNFKYELRPFPNSNVTTSTRNLEIFEVEFFPNESLIKQLRFKFVDSPTTYTLYSDSIQEDKDYWNSKYKVDTNNNMFYEFERPSQYATRFGFEDLISDSDDDELPDDRAPGPAGVHDVLDACVNSNIQFDSDDSDDSDSDDQ
jgi:hypothetical protein